MQAARSRSVLCPILLGLGVEMDHTFGSKFLVYELAKLGFSVSYDEVIRYKQSVVLATDPDHISGPAYPNAFTQWVADNVDHNIRTLGGYGTFHGMGIISASTPSCGQFVSPSVNVLRQSRQLLTAEILKNRGICIVPYHGTDGLATITLASVRQLQSPTVVPPVTNLNLLWHVAWIFSEPKCPRPNWSGFYAVSLYWRPLSSCSDTDVAFD